MADFPSRLTDLRMQRRRKNAELSDLLAPARRSYDPADIRRETKQLAERSAQDLNQSNLDILREVGLQLPPSFKTVPRNEVMTAIPMPSRYQGMRSPEEPRDQGIAGRGARYVLQGLSEVGQAAKYTDRKILPSIGGRGRGVRGPVDQGPVQTLFDYSERAGRNLAQESTLAVQRGTDWTAAVPFLGLGGDQSFELRVKALQGEGVKRSDAINQAWEETDLNLPRISIPGSNISFTPNAQTVLEMGFDPMDLLITVGTVGFGGAAIKGGRLGMRAYLMGVSKSVVRENMFGMAGKATYASARAASRTGVATVRGGKNVALSRTQKSKLKRAARDYNIPDEIVKKIADGESLNRNPITGRFSSPLLQDEIIELYKAGWLKQRGSNSGVSAIPKTADLERAAFRNDRKTRLAQKAGAKFLGMKLWNPSATANTVGDKAGILYSQIGVLGSQFAGIAKDFVLDPMGGGDPMKAFRIRGNYVTADNIRLTAYGAKQWKKLKLPWNYAPDEAGHPNFTFGDVMERWNAEDGPDPSWFTGLNESQIGVITRMRKATDDMIQTLVDEGVIAADQVDEWQLLSRDGFHWISRRAQGKDSLIKQVSGRVEHELVMFNGGSGRSGSSTAAFLKSRYYETMIEGAHEGVTYMSPMEAFDAFMKSAYQQIAEKRTMEYVEQSGKVITSKEGLRKLRPDLYIAQEEARSALHAAKQHVNRLRSKNKRNKAKQPLLNEAARKADNELDKAATNIDKKWERVEDLTAEVAKYTTRLRHARGVRQRTKTKTARNKWNKEVQHNRAMLEKRQASLAERQRDWKDTAKDYDKRLKDRYANNSAQARGAVNQASTDRFADDVSAALDMREMAEANVKAAAKDIEENLERFQNQLDLPENLFPYAEDATDQVNVKVGKVNLGGYTGKILTKDLADSLEKRFGDTGSEVARKIGLFTGTARTLGAGVDIAWGTIQGAALMFSHPDIWAKGMAQSMRAIKNPEARSKYVIDNLDAFVDFANAGGDIGSSEFFQALDASGGLGRMQGWMAQGAAGHKIPENALAIWGQHVRPIGRLATGFNTFLDVGKIEMWKSMSPAIGNDIVNRRDLASFINNSLGTLNTGMLGVSPRQRSIESGVLFFSPRFTRSAVALLQNAFNNPLRGVERIAPGSGANWKQNLGGARRAPGTDAQATIAYEAQKQMAALIAGGTAVMWGIGEALGQEVETNPFKPGWLTVTVGESQVGIGGAGRAIYDVMFKTGYDLSGLGEESDPTSILKWNVFGDDSWRENPLFNYVLNRGAPYTREIITGQTFDGEPIDRNPISLIEKAVSGDWKGLEPTAKAAALRNFPFVLQGQFESRAGTPRPGALSMGLQMTVARERPLSAYERLEKVRNAAAATWVNPDLEENPERTPSGLKWDELDLDVRQELSTKGEWAEELQIKQEAFHNNAAGPSKPYFDLIEQEKLTYNDAVSLAYQNFARTRNGPDLQDALHDANTIRRASREERENDPVFADVIEDLKDSAKSDTQFNRLFNEYVTLVITNPEHVDQYGDYDYDQRDLDELAFRSREDVDEETFERIKNYARGRLPDGSRMPKKVWEYDEQGMAYDYEDAKELMRPYWDVPETLLADKPVEHLEAYKLWQSYRGDPAAQEAIKLAYPVVGAIEKVVLRIRQTMRMRDPQLDLALVTYKARRALHPENRRAEIMRQRDMIDDIAS